MAYFLYLYSIKVEGYVNLVNFGLSNHFSQFRGQVREGFNYLQDFDHELYRRQSRHFWKVKALRM